jgi:hypothetical protein
VTRLASVARVTHIRRRFLPRGTGQSPSRRDHNIKAADLKTGGPRYRLGGFWSAPTRSFAIVVASTRREYDRSHNMSCVENSNTNGPCPNWTFNGNNRINNTGSNYGLQGNPTAEGVPTGLCPTLGKGESHPSPPRKRGPM